MWLVLADGDDADAAWAHRELRRRGVVPVDLVTTRDLAAGHRWVHRVDRDGCIAEVTLAGGRVISSTRVRGVLNRIAHVSVDRFRQVREHDRGYAEQEFIALLLSWLRCFPNTLNPAVPGGLCGRWRSATEWHLLASRAGLPVTALRIPTATPLHAPQSSAIVIAGEVVADAGVARYTAACRALAELAETPLLQVDFTRTAAGVLHFAGASPLPALRRTGERGADALAEALTTCTAAGAS